MLEVHAPHQSTHSWRDFLIHIATICVGLLIAIGLEQTVEAFHRHHQREQLQADLREEAIRNREVITSDLRMRQTETWFLAAQQEVDQSLAVGGKVQFKLPPAPCIPGSVGTPSVRYFAPSEAVLTTAKESGLLILLPPQESRKYARLLHNYDLLAGSRDQVAHGCDAIVAMQQRFGKRPSIDSPYTWTMTPAQAETLAVSAANARIATEGLCFRLRWSDVYEQGIISGEEMEDQRLMGISQEYFQDPDSAQPPTP